MNWKLKDGHVHSFRPPVSCRVRSLATARQLTVSTMAETEDKSQPVAYVESPLPKDESPLGVIGEEEKKLDAENVKLDKHGFPLVPQPSDNKDDPLVCTTKGS